MSEQTPELRWAPIEPKPKSKGRIWLIVGLVIAGLVIIGALLFFLLPRDGAPAPGTSVSPPDGDRVLVALAGAHAAGHTSGSGRHHRRCVP
jgi:hypothetical protein